MYWPGGICDTDWLNAQVFSQQYEKNPDRIQRHAGPDRQSVHGSHERHPAVLQLHHVLERRISRS